MFLKLKKWIPFGKSSEGKHLGGLILLFAIFLTKKDSSKLFAPSKIKMFHGLRKEQSHELNLKATWALSAIGKELN